MALPKVLLSVHWNDASQVDEAHRLQFKWRRMSPLAALELLDAKFPDPVVRAGGEELRGGPPALCAHKQPCAGPRLCRVSPGKPQ